MLMCKNAKMTKNLRRKDITDTEEDKNICAAGVILNVLNLYDYYVAPF